MGHEYLDFDIAIARAGEGYTARVVASPAGEASAPFALPFGAADLAQFMVAVGPPRVSSRRLVPAAARVVDVKDYGTRLGQALLTGDVDAAFRQSLATATAEGKDLRVRLRLDGAPDLDPVPWEYLYDTRLDRFLTLSQETPLVRLMESLERPPVVTVDPPLRVLVMISSPTDMPELAVEREEQLLRATTGDLVKSGQLELVVLADATLSELQRALIDEYHVFHFIGHGGFDTATQEGVLVLEREDGTAHRVSASRLGTLLHDARAMQLAVLNACEGARSSGRDAFSGVAQELVRRGLPAVVAMQTEISDRAALVFTHEFYWFLTRGLPIDAAMCEVRKAMATSDEASEWGTAVLLRSGADQPFAIRPTATASAPAREQHWEALYEGAQGALAANAPATALTMLEQLEAERPGYEDVTELIERVRPEAEGPAAGTATVVRREPNVRPDGGEPSPPQPAPGRPWGRPPDGGTGGSPGPAGDDAPGPGNGGRRRRDLPVWLRVIGGLAAVGFALFMILVFIEAFRDPGDGATPSAEATAEPTTGPTTGPTSEPTEGGTVAPDALVLACGPAPTTPIAQGQLPIGCATTRPEMDGDFAEWVDLPVIVVTNQVAPPSLPPADFFSLWHAQWDREALYLHAGVTDPAVREVELATPSAFWQGDSISFEFGPDARDLSDSDPLRNGADRHVMIGVTADGAAAAVNIATGGQIRGAGLAPGVTAIAVRTAEGYEVEARVPWVVLGVDPPSRGDIFAGNLNVSDAAASRDWAFGRMISSNPARDQPHPGTWQWIVLGDG